MSDQATSSDTDAKVDAGRIADGIVRDLRPATVLGTAGTTDSLVEELRERGVDALGIDLADASLTEPIERRFDLIVCIEVLEHLPPAETGAAIASICAATDRLLVSSAPDDFGNASQLNVRPPEAWAAALAAEGFVHEIERDVSYVTPWAALYTRSEEPLPEVVRRYERSWIRARREADQLRDSLLSANERLAEREERADREPELRAELESRQREILRLRDLLIGKEAELGALRGRLAEYDDKAERIGGVRHRLSTRFPLLRRMASPFLALVRRASR